MQPLLLFFIDAASFIDAEDPRWALLLATTSQDGAAVIVSHIFCLTGCERRLTLHAVPHYLLS